MIRSEKISLVAFMLMCGAVGCIETHNVVEVKPIEIKPMKLEMTVDVKIDKSLDEAMRANVNDPNDERTARYKRRMARQDQLNAYKKAKAIIETKNGFLRQLDVSGPASDEIEKLVQAENSDRMEMYKAVAKANKQTVEEVGEVWAKRFADRELRNAQKVGEPAVTPAETTSVAPATSKAGEPAK
ncbi:MAG: DUF1318 domain-containing protein [Victivallaceae bacterium]